MSDRILFVSTQMEAGGAQVLAVAMLKALQKEQADASLAFLYRKRPIFEGLPGVRALFPRRPRNPLDFVVIVYRLFVLTWRYRPTAIVGFAHYSSPLAAIIGWLCGVPKRIGTQTSPPDSHNLAARALDWVCGTLGLYTSNVAASQSIQDHFSRYPASYRRRLKTIYNGVQPRSSDLTMQQARASFGLDPAAFLIINCGRLSEVKNQAFLLDVIERLPDARLAILGEGELRGAMEAEIDRRGLQDRVTLLGEVDPARVGDFLRCGNVFAFPSRYEAFGIALAEAMLAGLPVVASNYPSLVEVVADAGILLPIDDPAPWAAAIEGLKSDPAASATAARRAATRGRYFSFESMLDGFKSAWKQG